MPPLGSPCKPTPRVSDLECEMYAQWSFIGHKNKIMPVVGKWKLLVISILSEISQTQQTNTMFISHIQTLY